MTRGFVTIATGNEMYYRLAVSLLHSYKNHCGDGVPFALICDRENRYSDEFDEVILVENPHDSYMDKLLLYRYSPFEETIFIDADSLVLKAMDEIWADFEDADDVSCYGMKLPLNSNRAWFSYDGCGDYKQKIQYLIDLHGGVYYFRKTERCRQIFEQAIVLAEHYSDYGFKNFKRPADEPVMAMSMAIHHCCPCEKRMRIIFVPSYRGRLQINYKGDLLLDHKKCDIEICHFAAQNTKLFVYRYLAEKVDELYQYGKTSDKLFADYVRLKIKTAPQNLKATVRHIVTLITLAVAGLNTHRLTPELKVSIKKPICSFRVIKELVGSGIWNSISIGGNTLLSGLDLLICNVYLGATMMGVLSLSKILPNILVQLSESIRGGFGPELTISFAKGDKENIFGCIQRAMKITSVIVTIPTAGIVVMGDAFYSLWVPSQDAKLLQILSVLAILSYLLNSGVTILFNVFTTVNKVRYNSAAMLISGMVSIVVTFGLIIFTDWDLYAVAGVSSVVTICKNLFFTVPVASKLLGFKWYQFYPQVGISMLCSGLIIAVGFVVRMFMPVDSWVMFVATCCMIGAIGLALNLMIVLNREERAYLFGFVKRKIKK